MGAIRKTTRREHNTLKKARFRALVKDAGWTQEDAAAKVKVPQPTATRWLKQVSERRTSKFRPGRPKILTPAMLDRIEIWFTGHYDHRVMSLHDIIREFELNCSPSAL